MESICTDSFWDTNLTWGNERQYPEFTKCFQDTVLIWLPSALLWLSTPLYLYVVLQFKDDTMPWSWKSVSKLSICVAQLSVRYLQLSLDDEQPSARVLGFTFEGITVLLCMYYVWLERRKAFVTSGIQTVYWFLACVCWGLLSYSDAVSQSYNSSADSSRLIKAYLFLSITQFFITWFADVQPLKEKSRECELQRNSFINRICFSWFSEFMNIGPQRPIDGDDIGKLMPTDQSSVCIPKFQHTWKEEAKRIAALPKRANGEKRTVGLLRVMLTNDWPIILACNLLMAVALVFRNIKPIMLGFFVSFMECTEQPIWKGYVYMVAFAVCLAGEFMFGNYMEHIGNSTARRLQNTLNSAVFRKSMSMTNKARAENTTGEIVNLLMDVGQVQHFIAYIHWNWEMPLNLVTSLIILYYTVDYAIVAGFLVLVLVIPLNTYCAKKGHNFHLSRMDTRDKRIKLMTEILNGIKILKLYAWELVYGDMVMDIRKKEMQILYKQMNFGIYGALSWGIAPMLMSVATFATYVMTNEEHKLNAGTAFTAMATFGMLTHTFNCIPHVISHVARSMVSMRRLEKFLNNEDIDKSNVTHDSSVNAVTIEDGTFTWDAKLGPCLKDINVEVPTGSLVAIMGTVGCGKSSLLSAMLGEMVKDNGKVNVHGSTAYVPQQAWIQNETLKNNILFGNKFREGVYNDIIDSCALTKDLEILPGGDLTEIGEKGINLSGGQKQRVSIARSVYYNADVYLFDDPLSAVDSHVGKHIFDHVIGENGLLRNKTRVLVTHGITWLPYVDKIFVMENGRISECGTYKQLLENEMGFAEFIRKYENRDDASDDEENEFDEVRTSVEMYEGLESQRLHDLAQLGDMSDKANEPLLLQRMLSDSGYSSPVDSKDNLSRSRHNSESNKAAKTFRRSISRAISHEDRISESDSSDDEKPVAKLIRQATFDDKFKLTEKTIKAEAAKCDGQGKLIEDEEIESGKVQMKYIIPYFKSLGPYCCATFVFFLLMYKVSDTCIDWCTRDWTDDALLKNVTLLPANSTERYERNLSYIKHYLYITLFFAIADISTNLILGFAVVRAATFLHENMLKNILRGPMAFFDTTPVGRICARFSHDIEPLDGAIAREAHHLINCTLGLLNVFIVIAANMPQYVFMIIPITYGYYEIQRRFIPIRRQLSRLISKGRAPIHSHFTECLNGTSTIRAYNMQNDFSEQSKQKVEHLMEVVARLEFADRWLRIRLDGMNLMSFVAAAALALYSKDYISAAVVGMSINYALQLNGHLSGFVRVGGQMEKNVVCIERVGQYSSKKQEAALHTDVMPAKSWPNQGQVSIKDYSLRYRDGLPLVLKSIDVNIKPGEKVGIVGRTGAGKSSLTLGLFRLVEPAAGSIQIDDHDISKLGLFDLRSNITILPQEPVLFSGTLRSNLDPLNNYSDEVVFQALEHAHLKSFVDRLPDKLEYDCGEGGQNLSVGQRQLICLARSLLRKSNVLVLDEATAAVDMKTDELIQNTIKEEFKECTVLTIAHRLNTIIDYDRILVLDRGHVKEFDSPKVLLENKNSEFYSMAKDSGLVK